MTLLLERLHEEHTRFLFDKRNKTYTCGRAKRNDIICLSLLVSRRHCIFFHDNDSDLYITDVGSSNGIFINGEAKQTLETIKLFENDIIGIGCPKIDPTDKSLFTYKVCVTKSPVSDEEVEDSVLSETVLNNNSLQNMKLPVGRVLGKKYESNFGDVTVPHKISKIVDTNEHNSRAIAESIDSNCSHDIQNTHNDNNINKIVESKSDTNIEDDIEIIHISLAKEAKKDNRKHRYKSTNKLNNKEMDIGKASERTCKSNGALDSTKVPKIKQNDKQIIKSEDELQLTDDDEEAQIMTAKTTHETSAIKLKKIKREPTIGFSEIDVVDLSDDEEGVFPYSLLFDMKFEDNTVCKTEIKQEFVDNDDQNNLMENIGLLDADDESIIVSDSENEDNPWLERLSRSQLLNEDKNSKKVLSDTVVKSQVDLGIVGDDVLNIVQSEISCTSKAPQNTETSPRSSTNKDAEIEDEVNINNNDSLNVKVDTMEVDIGLSNELSLERTDKNQERIDIQLASGLHKQTVSIENIKQKLAAKKVSTKRLIPVIEPLSLPVRRRRKIIEHNKDKTPKVHDNSPEEKKTLKLKEKPKDDFYNKERKHHHKKSKSTTECHSSSEIKVGPSISKDDKKMLVEKRKAKLKEIAEEKKKQTAKNNECVKRRIAKPRAKISLKNRGDFLVPEEPPTFKSLPDESTKSSQSSDVHPKKRLTDKVDVPKESAVSDIETSRLGRNDSTDTVNNIAISLQQSLYLDSTSIIPISMDISMNSIQDFEAIDSRKKRYCNSRKVREKHEIESTTKVSESKNKLIESASVQKESCLSNNLISECVSSRSKSLMEKKSRVVSFCDKPEIKTYQIEKCNSMKKVVGKDAPLPTNKLTKPINISTEQCPKLDEFLLRIFMWNPVWLEEQRYCGEPPVVSQHELQEMKLSYESYKQYYDVALPLLLLEMWCTMTKEFEMVARNKQHAMTCSIIENSVMRTPVSTNLFLTTLKLEILVDKEDLNKNTHPNYGDLVCLEYAGYKYKILVYKIFAYVTNLQQTIITEFTHYNKDLRKYVKKPYAVITCTLLTRPLDHDILVNRVQRIKTVMYLRANIRMIQALQYLPRSPLMNLILNPKVEDYQLPEISIQYEHSSLVTKDNLNPKQMEAVFRVTEAVLRKEAKLCFIQGPPGTGKSKVIVNLVTQILYGEHRQKSKNKSLRILICAPSNAAIDEIVIRLIDIGRSRKKLTGRSFRMVRIGKLESMHPRARTVSITELSRKNLENDLKRVKTSQSSIAEDVGILKAKMNSLRAELANNKINETRRKELEKKLDETLTRHELLECDKSLEELSQQERSKYEHNNKNNLISKADIIACTLSSCYTNQMESIFGGNKERISVCIVDEATQSSEAETLIPLMLGVNTLVLVGDPNQLPATILSQRAKTMGLDQSIFSRVQKVFKGQPNSPIIMLDTQYRMEYAISYWPNKFFYDGKLRNAAELRMKFPFHSYRVLNHNFLQNDDKFSNTTEAEFVANLIYAMFMFAKWECQSGTISLGILTPYNNQRSIILNKINEKTSPIPSNIKKRINFEVNTVDGFQGQERDVIIMSCVRSNGIGFLSDRQRLCVALTRAKHSLILCGNFNTFMKDQMWHALLLDAQSRGIFCHIDAEATPAIIKQFIIK